MLDPINTLDQISNATVFEFRYFSSAISYQAYFVYVGECLRLCGKLALAINQHVTSCDDIIENKVILICYHGFKHFLNAYFNFCDQMTPTEENKMVRIISMAE